MSLKRGGRRFLVRAARVLGAIGVLSFWGKRQVKSSFRKTWKGGLPMAQPPRTAVLGFSLVLLFALLLGTASSTLAAEKFCSEYGGVLDGNVLLVPPVQVTIDTDCTFQNWPPYNPLTTTINFHTNDPSIYLIIFNNVWYDGNMACANIPHKLWVVNSEEGAFSGSCQDIMIPAETIAKQSPVPTASIGVPFTYTLTLPSMNYPAGEPSTNTLGNVVLTDDLNAVTTDSGVELSYDSQKVYWKGGSTLTEGTEYTFTDDLGKLTFDLPDIPAGQQLIIELTVVLDVSSANTAGKVFRNFAGWQFSRSIDLDEDGLIEDEPAGVDLDGDGVPGEHEFFNPLPGEGGISQPMTIAEPNLVVDKTSTVSNLNVGTPAPFEIDVHNDGGSTAWNVEITDILPDGPDVPPGVGGMCDNAPTNVTAQVVAADSSVRDLDEGTHYSVSFDNGTCGLTLTFSNDPDAYIGPNEHLIIDYQAQLDAGTEPGLSFTNIAGATRWSNADSSSADRFEYIKTLSNGTPGTPDFQDAYTIISATQGYFFLKSVEDLSTGESPASAAFPGDRLRYTLQIQNFTYPRLDITTIADELVAEFESGTLAIYSAGTNLPVTPVVDANGGPNGTGSITIPGFALDGDTQYQIQFDVTLAASLTAATVVSNHASLQGIDEFNVPWSGDSDDPYNSGPALLGGPSQATDVTIQAPGVLSKANPAITTATIGDQFTYQISVPANPVDVPLYDVQILDNLSRLVSGADLRFVSATAHLASGAQSWTLTNSGPDDIDLILEETITGIDIPAGDRAIIEVTVQLQNSLANDAGDSFTNRASYNYNKINGGGVTTRLDGGEGGTPTAISVVEPALTAFKTVANVTAGKAVTDPAAAGDTLRYTVSVTNIGSSEAFDTDIVDTLPGNASLVPGSATATINGSPVSAFAVGPTELTPGTFVWGSQNGDGSLDIPVGQTLVLTYQVNVLTVDGTPITNSVYVDWSSLDSGIAGERTGDGCPAITAPDDYCYVPTPATIDTIDPTTIVKSVVSDSWDTAPSTAADSVLRVGDTVVYRLALTLREGVTQNVVITDTLDTGLAFASVISINGDSSAPFSSVAPFTYTDFSAPVVSGNTVTWSLGDIANAIDHDTANDIFVIEYRALVLKDTLTQAPSTSLANNVALSYTGSDPASTNLQSGSTITVWQPVMSTPTKTATGFTSPANVDIVNDVMPFQLRSCNNGSAPAYNAEFTDVLANQMDETSITAPVVILGSTVLNAGTDYEYTYTAADRTMTFELNTPVNPTECVTIDYTIGFHSDVVPNQTWNNSVTLDEYWSLATPTTTGQQYGPLTSTPFVMTNPVTVQPLTKVVTSPASGEATIGEDVVYEITVPSSPVNAALNNVVVSDTLNGALEYVSATAVDNVGNPVTLTDNSIAPGNVNLAIAQIPAGQWVTITLRTRVANNTSANAGLSFTNTAAYTYTGMADPTLTEGTSGSVSIVEPLINVTKNVNPVTAPNAGDILTYTVNLAAQSGPDKSKAYDTEVVDSLSLGLAYVAGSATVNGSPVEPVLNAGDGIINPQTLTWSGIDIPEGISVQVIYSVQVLNGIVAGQSLTNSATARWTSLDGSFAYERDGSGTPTYNDYFAMATTSLTVGDNTSLAKAEVSDTYNDGTPNVRIGDRVEYELRLGLQEGTTTGVVLTDDLPTGMAYDGLVSISPASGSSNFTYSVASQPATGDTGELTWNLGTVVNAGDNEPSNDYLVIRYRVRVLNNDVLAQTPTTQTLTNNARLDYTIGGAPATPKTASQSLYVLQPLLAVTKSAAPAGGDTVIVAGETVYYTVDITNSGAAPAYDTVLTDTLPIGLRQGVPAPTTISITLVDSATNTVVATLANLAPSYNASSGVVNWNFDSGSADAYTIPVGETLRITYQVQADANLGPNQTLTNTATVTLYYSFDDEAPPAGATVDQREVYGPSNTDTTTLTTPLPVALVKEVKDSTQTTASIGVPFSYIITVPATPQPTALNDVRIVDDLTTASVADLSFVSVSKVSTWGTWTPINTGDAKHLVIEDPVNGIDIPAGERAEIEITVVLDNSAKNLSGLVFNNTANYTYNISHDPGLPGTSGDLTIAGPDTVILNKTGPATMRRGLPGTFTLNVLNTGTAPAWDLTVKDLLPNPTPGGMCDNGPTNVTARVFQNDGSTPVSGVLTQGADYVVGFSGAPGCTLTLTMRSAVAAIGPGERLIVTYDALLDNDSVGGTSLTNIAAATQWFSGDTAGGGATGSIRTYTGTLSNGTVGTDDEQDAHTLLTESPVLIFQKSVVNLTSGQDPGTSAKPGDRLRYTIHVENVSPIDLPDFALVDELDALNATALFVPGSLTVGPLPVGAADNTNPTGGAKGTGLLDIRNLDLDAQGGANASMDIVFEATLVPVINSGTVVLNQALLSSFGVVIDHSDDPNVSGDEDPTRTLINSAPSFEIWKTSQDLTGDPAVLLAGDTMRYTITLKNIGNENAVNVILRDQVPANTTYVANSTTLNGNAVADPAAGVSPLQDGLLINAPEDTTPGALRADATSTTTNVATIAFEVTVNGNVLDGTVIANQGFANGSGAGSGSFPEHPSDDPATSALDDPTRDVVGSLPLVDAQKTVQIQVDINSNGLVDPGDTLRYTITINNLGAIPATNVVFTDAVPADTTYQDDSTFLNGESVADPAPGVSPLVAGIPVSSSDLTPPLPTAGNGVLSPGAAAVITFAVLVDPGVSPDTVISNQGLVTTNELPDEPTDADGIDANGDQPTQVIVGPAQLLSITKEVFVVGGGAAEPGAQLEYLIRVTNIGNTPATNVVVTDDLGLLTGQVAYIAGSGLMNGSAAGVSYTGSVLTADYAAQYGVLQPGAVVNVRFRVEIDPALPIGATITNQCTVSWNVGTQSTSASVSLDVGGTPGSAGLNGRVWHDANLDKLYDSSELTLAGWSVELYRNNVLLTTTLTDANGAYILGGVVPNQGLPEPYEVRFRAPGAGPNTATLGYADSPSPFINGPQRISGIFVAPSSNQQNMNLPIWPNGVVFNSVIRNPVAGATLTMLHNGGAVAGSCFDDPAQQNQVTVQSGFYKFDLNFSDPSCPQGGDYVIRVTPPAGGYMTGPSRVIPPVPGYTDPAFDPTAAPYPVPTCPDDAVTVTPGFCEAQPSGLAPGVTVPPAAVKHYLFLTLNGPTVPGDSQLFNNHIPIDPELTGAVAITKTTSRRNVTKGQLVPYTITVNNVLGAPLYDIGIVDRFPAGFKYVKGSARLDGVPTEPAVPQANVRELVWSVLTLQVNDKHTLQLLLVVGAGVTEEEYVNRAQVINRATGEFVSGEATATVRVIPDPDLDCTDVIGKVFDDRNLNGYQDQSEQGLAGVRVATVRGLVGTTDEHGRFHITCAAVPDEDRGSNFILKLDDRTLPTGYRVTTENPRVQRATRGKMLRVNFGATIHRVVSLDIADGVFEPGSTEMRLQWQPRIARLLGELRKAPALLRLSYLAEVEREGLVEQRLKALKKEISDRWDGGYRLTIETEIYWRRGSPP